MAQLWSKVVGQTRYEVRSAGATIRLYSNGVLHSQFNPNHIISGAIWDLLLLPGFCLAQPPKRVLMLGLGGGTLVHMIRHFFPGAHIDCVELDKQHIQIAKRWFKIPKKHVKVIHGDAYEFLKEEQRQYDWIIDDVFQHASGDPERPLPLTDAFRLYESNLKRDGLVSLNLIGAKQITEVKTELASFLLAKQFSHPLYENRIVALSKQKPIESTKAIKQRMNEHRLLNQSFKTCRLRYRMTQLTN